MKKILLILSLFVAFQTISFAQVRPQIKATNKPTVGNKPKPKVNNDIKLANQYFVRGEYEKAVVLYKKLFDENPNSTHFYKNYYRSLLKLKRYTEAETVLREQMRRRPKDVTLLVDLGLLYKTQDKEDQAQQQFDKALEKVDYTNAASIANAFTRADELDLAISCYKKAGELTKGARDYSLQLAYIYKRKGEMPDMMTNYLNHAEKNPSNVQTVKIAFQKVVTEEEYMEELMTQLYGRIQKKPDVAIYYDLLTWSFIQQKDFDSAFTQAKALDKRFKEDGSRMIDLAKLAAMEKEYDVSVDALEYLIEEKPKSKLLIRAKKDLLKYRKLKVTEMGIYTPEDLTKLKKEYIEFLEKEGETPQTVKPMRELSHLYAYYLHDIGPAINLLHKVLDMPAVSNSVKALTKLDLGDYYLMKNEVWEATLLYSQVDKALKDDILGEEARFKNARLSYFNGDFVWSQAQLDVLKASTSELIANDALELSVFITDNMGLDTTTTPMKMYARGELLLMQNKADQAFRAMDSVNLMYPDHVLEDDILLRKAKFYVQQKNYPDAVNELEKLLIEYKEEILADDALFMLGEINELHLEDKTKAMEYYQELLVEHPGSLYVVEARKRYRKLRGDVLN